MFVNAETAMNKLITAYATASRERDRLESEMNEKINLVRLAYIPEIEKIDLKSLEDGIKTLCEKHRHLAGTHPAANIGFRKSTELSILDKELAVKELEAHEGALDIKKSIRKSALSAWSDEALAEIGISRIKKENFFIKLNN